MTVIHPPESTALKSAYKIEQGFRYLGDNWWTWWVLINADEKSLNAIQYVEYILHPTFRNPVREVHDRSTSFMLKTEGWGQFKIYANIFLKNGEEVALEHELHLEATAVKANTTSNEKLEIINRTRSLLRGEWKDSKELESLYKELEKLDQYAYATDVLLAKIKQDEEDGKPISLKEYQTLVKFIYKDHSLPAAFKFDKAIQKLNAHDELSETSNCETLGLAGAIYKYRWLHDHQSRNLKRSFHYYKRGFESWKGYLTFDDATKKIKRHCNDDGFTAINYAFILELMAMENLEELGMTIDISDVVKKYLDEADETRDFIIKQLDTNLGKNEFADKNIETWIFATVAEAYFGLRRYDAALTFIKMYKQRETDSWKLRTFSRQILSIAYLQHVQLDWYTSSKENPHAKTKLWANSTEIDAMKINECLAILVHNVTSTDKSSRVDVKREGKFGLALSGGGFRASIFHIGMLAALAERNKLKDLEVISCVSGGSILGAYYYLKLRNLLQHKPDQEIEREDYIKLVKELEQEFLDSVQYNLRMRVLSNLICNMRMIFDRRYSRTHRLGELYERYFYSKILKKDNGKHIFMSDMKIIPHGEPDFSISTDNWRRKNKVPQIIFNATTVNTGHNWQFAATWMGEPPGSIQSDVDVKPRLRRMYYEDAPKPYQEFRLGYAVGASSCVPVLFTPIPLPDLYSNIELQLVDGGLHDNQGIAALIEQECSNMIISDASGQMPTTIKAEKGELSVFRRSDTVLQERVRELQFKDLRERKYTAQLSSLVTVHLKSGLHQRPISWKDCDDPPRSIYDDADCAGDLTKYGVLKTMQTLLSEVRTDLDSFHETEAYALMYSGYSQMHYELDVRQEKEFAGDEQWKFLSIRKTVTDAAASRSIEKILSTSKKVPLKILDLYPSIKYTARVIAGLVVVAFFYWGFLHKDRDIPISVNAIVWTALVFLIGFLISKPLAKLLNIKSLVQKKAIWVLVMIAMWIASNVYLWFFNPLYNKAGKVKK